MKMPVTSKLARLAKRLSLLGSRHKEFEDRIAAIERRENPCKFILRRLQKEKTRIQREMQSYEDVIRTVAQRLSHPPAVNAA